MSRKFHITSIEIFDALMAKGKKIGINGLLNIAKQKSILISKDDERNKLAEYVSQLPFDYDDIVSLYEIIEQDNRREKLSSSQIKSNIDYPKLQKSIENLASQLALSGERAVIVTNPESRSIIVDYEYLEVDFGKATMLQETLRKDRVEFLPTSKSVTNVRYVSNVKCKELVDRIIKEIERFENSKFEIDEIELSHIKDGKRRNDFFFTLINGLDGMNLDDVSGIKISRNDETPDESDEEGDNDVNESNGDEIIPTDAFVGFIKEVALKGKALLGQKEYLDFVEKGFFISNLTWKSLDNSIEPNLLVEFEAGFEDHQECKGFQYAVKGAYFYKKDESGFSRTRKPLPEPNKILYKSKIENAARMSKEQISHDKT